MLTLNRNIDILKYLMSIMIIMIHVGYSFKLPILRCAVPVFFIISSFLFFKKINSTEKDYKVKVLFKFISRALKLYLFWFILLLPVTIIVRGWYQMSMVEVIQALVIGLLF